MGTEEERPDPVAPPRTAPVDERADAVDPAAVPDAAAVEEPHPPASNMLPGRERRRSRVERLFVRLIATGGVVGIGVALGAILGANKVQGWIIGLVIALVSVLLSAVLWSSRQL
ncbi:MAG: hypothetical protein ACR2L9_00580 [Solirubrobacteraceae bacterium]